MARASSGSRSSIRSIEPLMSANRAVTVLRSPSKFSGADISVTRVGVSFEFATSDATVGSARKAAPQESQNFASVRFSAPHEAHLGENLAPHLSQKRAPSRLSAPHFAQRMVLTRPPSLARRSRLSSFQPGPWIRRDPIGLGVKLILHRDKELELRRHWDAAKPCSLVCAASGTPEASHLPDSSDQLETV